MRMTDRLMTETPRPCLDDTVFTDFHLLCPDPTVIEGTDVMALFMEMTMFATVAKTDEQLDEIDQFRDALGSGPGWQTAQFFQFDFSTIGVVAPPFDNFVIEFDVRESMERTNKRFDGPLKPRDILPIGQSCAAFTVLAKEVWAEQVSLGARYARTLINTGPSLDEIDALDFAWIYCVTTYRMTPGKGLIGPLSTWLIPVDHDGRLYMTADDKTLMVASALGPRTNCEDDILLSNQYAITQGWSVIVPALLALSFLHTPRTTKDREGYHDLVDAPEYPARMAKKYLQRNFRPLTKWVTLDIAPLRRAVTEAHGGSMPKDFAGLAKALHVVRGHTATYMPNTYFGKKHERPITVFRPSYRRGEVKAGIVQKEYRLNTEESA